MSDDSSENEFKLRISESSSENDSDLEVSNRNTESEDEDEVPNDGQAPKEESLIESGEWIKFNNQVISMRPAVKSATVQFIHRSTRMKNQLLKKKGSEEQLTKNKNKAERIVQEILYIKTLKKDVIAKFALLHSKEEVAKIVHTGTGTLEYRVKAKLALMPMVSQKAEVYHKNNPGWRESLYKLIQLAGKTKKRQRRKIRGKGRPSKKGSKEKQITEKKNKPGKVGKSEYDEDRFGDSQFPEPPSDLEDDVGSREEETAEVDRLHSGESSDEGDISTVKLVAPKKKPNAAKSRKNKPEKTQKRQSGSFEKAEILHGAHSSGDEDEGEKPNVDPFFMTSDNKEYKTLWKVEPADSFKYGKSREPEYMFKNALPVGSKKRVGGPTPGRGGKLPRPSKREQTNGKTAKTDVPVENLHPSWQAKKKLNVSTAAFQGKKVVFDD